MSDEPQIIADGTVTSARGFRAGAAWAGINKHARFKLDVGLLASDGPCQAAGVFTRNLVKAAPVLLSQGRLPSSSTRAVVVNSGCANAATGDEGLRRATQMAAAAAAKLGVAPASVLVASTGVIGQHLPLTEIQGAVKKITPSPPGRASSWARAIMTTDTVPKEAAFAAGGFTVGGAAKGSGMIHPDMGTDAGLS